MEKVGIGCMFILIVALGVMLVLIAVHFVWYILKLW